MVAAASRVVNVHVLKALGEPVQELWEGACAEAARHELEQS